MYAVHYPEFGTGTDVAFSYGSQGVANNDAALNNSERYRRMAAHRYWPLMNTDEPHMAGRPATLENENTLGSPIEESMSCRVFSEQRG
jgi:hypothetical protein